MIGRGTKQLDLYDFFSIFIPGATLLIALVPLLPKDFSLPAAAAIGVLIIGGVVVGRAIHATRLFIESEANANTHRTVFIDELLDPDEFTENLVNQAYYSCIDYFDDIELPDDRSDLDRNSHEDDLNTLYLLIRSHIHMDSRGRSRTFQAIYDFYGSMWIVSSILFTTYYTYAILNSSGWPSFELVQYQSFLGSYNIDPLIIGIVAGLTLGVGYYIFRNTRLKYRKIYVQYLFADYIVVSKEDDDIDALLT